MASHPVFPLSSFSVSPDPELSTNTDRNPAPSTPEIQVTRPTLAYHPYSTTLRSQRDQIPGPWNPQGWFTWHMPTTTPISTHFKAKSSPDEETPNLPDLTIPSSPSSLTFSSHNPSVLHHTLEISPPTSSSLPVIPTPPQCVTIFPYSSFNHIVIASFQLHYHIIITSSSHHSDTIMTLLLHHHHIIPTPFQHHHHIIITPLWHHFYFSSLWHCYDIIMYH